jgi:hypothetical protein
MREKIRRIIFLFFRILLQKKRREKKIQIHAYLMHICKNEKKNCIFNAYTRLARYKIYQKHIIKKLNYYQN